VLSLIIPLYNGENPVDELIAGSSVAFQQAMADFEIMCVDDGSRDQTLKKLLARHERDSRMKVLAPSRNFGHQ
jgi:polyisoprenyl-phosphate glycosyltransferase